jgi:hypothetical protein
MKRYRFPLVGLMAAVALVAINLAVIRAFSGYVGAALPLMYFACGVVPMASLLIMVAALNAPRFVRGESLRPFVVGFEALGWSAVFVFITCYSVVPSLLVTLIEVIGQYTRPFFARYLTDSPNWLGLLVEFVSADSIFSSPQLLTAVLGGWLTHKLGLTIRFERRGLAMSAARGRSLWTDTPRAHPVVLEWPQST